MPSTIRIFSLPYLEQAALTPKTQIETDPPDQEPDPKAPRPSYSYSLSHNTSIQTS